MVKKPAQFTPVAISQHTLNYQICMLRWIDPLQNIFLKTRGQTERDTCGGLFADRLK